MRRYRGGSRKSDGVCTTPPGECQLPVSQPVAEERKSFFMSTKKNRLFTFLVNHYTLHIFRYVNVVLNPTSQQHNFTVCDNDVKTCRESVGMRKEIKQRLLCLT